MRSLPPLSKYRFHCGPYEAPKAKVGDKLTDERLGEVEVVGFTKAQIPWPACIWRGETVPILCGSLVRAVCEEEEQVVAHYWGTSKYIVDQWKQAIAGAKTATEVFVLLALKRQDPEFRKKYNYPE